MNNTEDMNSSESFSSEVTYLVKINHFQSSVDVQSYVFDCTPRQKRQFGQGLCVMFESLTDVCVDQVCGWRRGPVIDSVVHLLIIVIRNKEYFFVLIEEHFFVFSKLQWV